MMITPTQEEADLWRDEIATLKAKTKASTSEQETIAFYGSSSIRLWDQMHSDLTPFPVQNLGFGGSSYYWCNYFFEEVFEDVSTKHIILYAGDNDLGNDQPIPFILEQFEQIIGKIYRRYGKILVSVISVKPSPERHYLKNRITELNSELAKSLQKKENAFFVDVYNSMLDDQQNVQPELYEDDQLHMSVRGYEIWKKVLRSHLKQLYP